jgi:stage IV sporulation protein FB
VLFAEPPRSPGDIHFVLFGIPVRIHPLFWLVAVMFGLGSKTPPVVTLLWVAALLLAILIHELGHSVVMRTYGYYPSIVLHGFGGLAIPQGPGRAGRWGQVLIAFAGPGAGFLLAAALYLGLRAMAGHGVHAGLVPIFRVPILPAVFIPDHELLECFLNDIFWISVLWGLINLLPIYPLDGGHIAQEILVWANPRDGIPQSLILSIATAGAMVLVAVTQWQSMWTAIFFGYLAYSSYMTLQAYR